MTQKIFDTDNEKDMALLWRILPSCIKCINKRESFLYIKNKIKLIHIDWHDKEEITRPVQEATEADVGKICAFWDLDCGEIKYGTLSDLIIENSDDCKYGCVYGRRWKHCRRLTKQEIEELC